MQPTSNNLCARPVLEIPGSQQPRKKLPEQIIANGQWIVADMDGTLIESPGYKKEPTLGESVAKEAIFDWIRAGGCLLVLTGCETSRTFEKFARFIPGDLEDALIERRLILATNGGAAVSYFDGHRWTEDPNFRNHALVNPIAIPNATQLLENAVKVINDFYRDLRDGRVIMPEHCQKKYPAIIEIAKRKHPFDFTLKELGTLDTDVIPRIEIRRADNNTIVQICIMGIPVELDTDISRIWVNSEANIEICKVHLTHEINVKGVDKALPIRWLQEERAEKVGYRKFEKEKSVAIGDRPNHNDAPLTTSVHAFVSVCEYDTSEYIPPHVTLHIGCNQAGTKKIIQKLLQKAEDFNLQKRMEPVIVRTLIETVEEIRKHNSN